MFIDEAIVHLKSGKGGDGSASFHREKHVPRGGPNGADGGRGGSVIFIGSRHQRTLYDLRLRQFLDAKEGEDAVGNKRGRDGKDIEVTLPLGTLIYDHQDGELIADLTADGQRVVICRGGRGGRGNLHFTNSVRQAPTFAEKGAPPQELTVRLELKLLADVGLIGLPNAGKSTLIGACSAAKPKIGAYPFTTLEPNLGVVSIGNETFVMADLPGLIEGASEGLGLGHQFLRHAERTSVLLHVVDAFPLDGSDPLENYKLIERELQNYSDELYQRPRIIALNKADLAPDPDFVAYAKEQFEEIGHPVFVISGATSQGLQPMLFALLKVIQEHEAERVVPVLNPVPINTAPDTAFEVVKTPDGWKVKGERVERLVAMTDLGNREAVRYLHKKLDRMGVIDALRDAGIEDEDPVIIDDWVFTFVDWL